MLINYYSVETGGEESCQGREHRGHQSCAWPPKRPPIELDLPLLQLNATVKQSELARRCSVLV